MPDLRRSRMVREGTRLPLLPGDDLCRLSGWVNLEQNEATQKVNGILNRERNCSGLDQKKPRLKLAPNEYAALRRRVLERDGWRCQGLVRPLTSSPPMGAGQVRRRQARQFDHPLCIVPPPCRGTGMRHTSVRVPDFSSSLNVLFVRTMR